MLARRDIWKPRLQRLAAKELPDPSGSRKLNETVSFPQLLCHCMRFLAASLDAHEFGIFDSALELHHQSVVRFDSFGTASGVGKVRG
jgi:hypothetical protein